MMTVATVIICCLFFCISPQVKVKVMDENDNSPSFDRHIYQGSIQENSLPGTEIALGSPLKVTDPDVNDIIKLQVGRKIIRFLVIADPII